MKGLGDTRQPLAGGQDAEDARIVWIDEDGKRQTAFIEKKHRRAASRIARKNHFLNRRPTGWFGISRLLVLMGSVTMRGIRTRPSHTRNSVNRGPELNAGWHGLGRRFDEPQLRITMIEPLFRQLATAAITVTAKIDEQVRSQTRGKGGDRDVWHDGHIPST